MVETHADGRLRLRGDHCHALSGLANPDGLGLRHPGRWPGLRLVAPSGLRSAPILPRSPTESAHGGLGWAYGDPNHFTGRGGASTRANFSSAVSNSAFELIAKAT